VLGVALAPDRLDPPVALARMLFEAGDHEAALAQLERVLGFDYAHEPAHKLKNEIVAAKSIASMSDTRPASPQVGAAATPARPSAESVEERYEILSELGRGGMGVVFLAKDTRLERQVAIKVLRTTSEEEADRLKEEAKAVAVLNHPGIVTVFDFEAGFGGYFIAMEYVPGISLDTLLRKDPERVRRDLVPTLVRVADAVAYAHDHRVIHRDLKPGNILVTPPGDAKILDFGIAARLDSESSGATGICGTPYYMAPEQIRGEVPTPASDIYSFGATTFHLATGQPPFPRGNVIGAHLNLAPPNPLELAPGLSPELAAIILRCLEKEQARRFLSAAELRDALRAIPA
jgi:serine/threonine-protein kinase